MTNTVEHWTSGGTSSRTGHARLAEDGAEANASWMKRLRAEPTERDQQVGGWRQ